MSVLQFQRPILHQWFYGKEFMEEIYARSTGGPDDKGAQAAAQKFLDEEAFVEMDKDMISYGHEVLGDVSNLEKKRKRCV